MDNEKWGEILDRVNSQFNVLEHTKTPDEGGNSEVETLIFTNPLGKIKLTWTTKPLVLDKKIIGAHRRGMSSAQYEYTYSDTEVSHKLEAFKEVGGDWETMDSSTF